MKLKLPWDKSVQPKRLAYATQISNVQISCSEVKGKRRFIQIQREKLSNYTLEFLVNLSFFQKKVTKFILQIRWHITCFFTVESRFNLLIS